MTKRITKVLAALAVFAVAAVSVGTFTGLTARADTGLRLIFSEDFERVKTLKRDTVFWDYDWNLNGEHSAVITPASKWDNYTTPLSGLQSYRFVSNNNPYEQRDNYVEFMDISPNELPLSPNKDYVISFKARTNNLEQLKVSFPNLGVGASYDFAFDPMTYAATGENAQAAGDYYVKPMNMAGDGQSMSLVYLSLNAKIIPSYGAVALFSGKKIDPVRDCCFDIDDFRVYEGRLNIERTEKAVKSNAGVAIDYDFETEQAFNTDDFVMFDFGSPTAFVDNVAGFSSKVLKVTEPANSGERALINLNETRFQMHAGKSYRVAFTYKTENVGEIKIEAFGLSEGGKAFRFKQNDKSFVGNDWSRLAPKIAFTDLGGGVTKFSYEMEKATTDGGSAFLMVVFPNDRTKDANVYIDDFSVTEIAERNLPQEPVKVFSEGYEGKRLDDIAAVRKNSPISVWQPGNTVTTARTTAEPGDVISGDTSLLIQVDGGNGDLPLFDITPDVVTGFRPGFVPGKDYTFSFKYRAENVNLMKFEFNRALIDSGNLEYLPTAIDRQTDYGSYDNEKWRCVDLGGGVYELVFSFTALSSRVDRPFLFCMHRTPNVTSRLILDDIRITSGSLSDYDRAYTSSVNESEDFEGLNGAYGMGNFSPTLGEAGPDAGVVYDASVINGAYSVAIQPGGALAYGRELAGEMSYTVKFKYATSEAFTLSLGDATVAEFDGSGVTAAPGVQSKNVAAAEGFVSVALSLKPAADGARLTFRNGAGTTVLDDFALIENGDTDVKTAVVKRQVSETEQAFIASDFNSSNATNAFFINRILPFPFLPSEAVADVSQTYRDGETINGLSSLKMRMTNDKAGIETYPAVLRVDSGAGGRCMASGTLYTAKFRYRILSDSESTVTEGSKFFAFAKWESALTPYNVFSFNQDGTADLSGKGGFPGYSNIVSAAITPEERGVFNVSMTFRTQDVEPYGLAHFGFGMVGGGTLIVDDFALYQGHNDAELSAASPAALPDAVQALGGDFETGLGDFYAWQDPLLTGQAASKLTSQTDRVINGAYSLYAGRDPRTEQDANLWSGFLRSKEGTLDFKRNTLYTVQLRFKILRDADGGGWFYVMLKAENNDACDVFFGFDADGVNYEYQRNVVYYDIAPSGDTCVLTVALQTADQSGLKYRGLELGSYRGGEILVDDVYVYEGAHTEVPGLPVKATPSKPVFVAENDFESPNGQWGTSGTVVDEGIYGKSLMLASQNTKEVMLSYNGELAPNTRYSVFFRYKPVLTAPYDGEGNFLLGVKTGFEAKDYKFYQSFSKDGKPLYYNYDGSFSGYQIYDLNIEQRGDSYDARFTVITGDSSDYKLYFGVYGCAAMLIDDISVNLGEGVSVPRSGDRVERVVPPAGVTLEVGAALALPEQVELTLNDGSKAFGAVTWANVPATGTAGTFTVVGTVDYGDYIVSGDMGNTVSLTVTVRAPEPEPEPEPQPDGPRLTGGQVAGIVVGSVCGAAALAGGAFLLVRALKKKKQ